MHLEGQNMSAANVQALSPPSPPMNGGIYIYPGSFDPVTLGHLDIIERAACMCGRLIVAVGQNREKKTMFTAMERMEMLLDVIAAGSMNSRRDAGDSRRDAEDSDPYKGDGGSGGDKLKNIEVVSFDGLLADYAKERGANVIVKGLRAMSDFEFEFQMALLNKYLDKQLETIFLMTSIQYTYLSSSAVKEIAMNGGCLDGLVPAVVIDRIQKKAHKRGG